MKICGPKCSLCGLIISVWGFIQLVLMGVFYYVNSVSLLEDLPLEESYKDSEAFYQAATAGYSLNAYNCWIAACLYIVTLIFSGISFMLTVAVTFKFFSY